MAVGCLVAKLKGVNSRCLKAHRGVKFHIMGTLMRSTKIPFARRHCNTVTQVHVGGYRLVVLGPGAFVGLDNGTIHC